MSSEKWKTYKINDLITDISMGPFGSDIKVECFVDSGMPVLNGSNLSGFKLKEESFKYVTEEKASSLRKAIATRGDIVITHRGTLGQIVCIPQNSKFGKYIISQSQFRVQCDNNKLIPEFLVYFFHNRLGQHLLLKNTSQVGVPALARPTSTFKDIEINIPDVATQLNIVNFLLSLDDKIELNNKINANLEQQAQAIFKSWFVDFEPFKDGEFVDSELGMIPKGWRVGQLCGIADIIMGQSPSGSSFNKFGDGEVFYQGRTDFGNRFPSKRLYTTEPKRIAQEDSVLMSVRAPVGDINIAIERCCIGRGLASIKSINGNNSFLLYTMFNAKDRLDIYNGEGTVFGSINKDSLNVLSIIVPEDKIMRDFDLIIKPFDKQIKNNYVQSHNLMNIRNILLPKLMNGEIIL